ncbi:MAG: 16S rRNA (cytidine(1402)-2'-O)-methyltransferase [Bacteroidota bacterium]|nr:16S rRNA (cytidine(1402)-2'-O)-methyltransferase [Candidatus Kapabacteria bacterium]MDW8218909.1 16S rRNA (cytidine(1402)-2'-O)-methyltransferase [Bacteroidota bacterium]
MGERLEPAVYLVPVPIGNRDDITLRALKTLQAADIIASEDTRTTGHLLALYGIKAHRLQSYYDYNEEQRAHELIAAVQQGFSVAIVSEAGSPCISDPGYRIVRAAIESSTKVVPLPGATAFVPALTASGLPLHRFMFVGFPPQSKGRQAFLRKVLLHEETVVMYESSHRVCSLLEELVALGAGKRRLCVAREITKVHEEFIRDYLEHCLSRLAARPSQKGEFVLVLEGKGES